AKDPDGAITAFNEALKLDPTLAAAKYELARAYLATGDATSAVIMARQAATEWPTEDTRLVFARALLAKGAGDEAHEQLASLAREFPKSATVQVLVGRLAMQRGDPAGARRAFEAALAAEPGSAERLGGLGQLDINGKNPAAAVARLEAAMKGAEKDPRLVMMLAQTHLAAGDTGAAEKDLKRAIAVDATLIEPYSMLGRL